MMDTEIQIAAAVILAHKLNVWGYCSCGERPEVEMIWTEETHARHVAGAVCDALEIGARP